MSRNTGTTRNTGARFARVMIAAVLALAAASAMAGCSKPAAKTPATPAPVAEKPSAPAYPITIKDDAGNEVTITKQPERIVSLAPADTELLFAVGGGKHVVGVTTYCDYPEEVKSIAKVGDFAAPNIEAVAAAKPDLILATAGVQADVVKQLQALGATVVVIDPQNLDGVYTDIQRVGDIVGSHEEASDLVKSMRTDVADIQTAVSKEPSVTAFVEIGQNPLYTVGSGTLIDELVKLAGGTNVVTAAGYVPYATEQVVKANPSVYLATKGSGSDPAQIEKRAGYSAIDAVKNGRVIILDDNLVSRPGPRVVLGLKEIAKGLHPDAFK